MSTYEALEVELQNDLIPASVSSAVMFLEDTLLGYLADTGSIFGPLDTCFSFRGLASTGIPPEILRALCRRLRDGGYLRYHRGLFTAEGYPAGAGYGLTQKGLDRAMEGASK